MLVRRMGGGSDQIRRSGRQRVNDKVIVERWRNAIGRRSIVVFV